MNSEPGSELNEQKFNDAVLEALWSENGELTYIIRDGLDLEEYAVLAKAVLEKSREIEHDFTGKVTNEGNTGVVQFEYRSGWFLDGLAGGKIE